MKLGFRWFGLNDPVSLKHIGQIPGVQAIVSSMKTETVGGKIDKDALRANKAKIELAGMSFDVFESLPLHNSIKLGLPEREHYIAIYKENIRLLASEGIKVIVYNFRPIIRWARTEIYKMNQDGSSVSVFYQDDAPKIDPFNNEAASSEWHKDHSKYIYQRQLTTDLELEGYYTPESLRIMNDLKNDYLTIGKEGLWDNLKYFLDEIIPVAEKYDVKMAMHPDDPPWDIFGLPRLMINEAGYDRLLACYDSPSNGLVFCSGTIGSDYKTDVVALARKYTQMGRVPFAHIRNVKRGEGFVEESAHYTPYGSIDMVELLKAFYESGYDGYVRSDHGRMIWGEEGKPGNGIYDRALGAQYILGIWETLTKN